jgi:stearoyl-CoA desaturase (delta-9 desaturase)
MIYGRQLGLDAVRGTYVVTGLGITVRLLSTPSFECQLGKAVLLVAGGWALENSALKWAADHNRHHAACDQESDPYNATRGFWYSHCGWLFYKDANANDKYASRLRQDSVVMWQHRHYWMIVLSGLGLTFAGFLNGWIGGLMLSSPSAAPCCAQPTFCINSVCHLWDATLVRQIPAATAGGHPC